jgi:hypothetical protein
MITTGDLRSTTEGAARALIAAARALIGPVRPRGGVMSSAQILPLHG